MAKKNFKERKIMCKSTGGIYGLGFIGAAIFYIQQSSGFWEGVAGVIKALVWPAFVVHKLLGL